MNDYVIHGFEPKQVFEFFEQISAIPRGSGNEQGIADYLERFARERGLDYVRDANNNLLIKKHATQGRENEAPLLFQGHTDMVCEKNGDVAHDFEHDGIRLIQHGNELTADGTTLGADNGIAVAMMMAMLDGVMPSHPAIECLFTTEEETGMGGAIAFDYSLLTARHMVNLDSEEEHVVTVGCAGGIRSDLDIPIAKEPIGARELCRVRLTGLGGGHSGADIHTGRQSANLLLGRLLASLAPDVRLVSVEGGSKDNAITREAEAVIAVPSVAMASMRLLMLGDEIAGELVKADEGCHIACERLTEDEAASVDAVMDETTTSRVLGVLSNAPCGVLAMSAEVEGLVEYSRNLGILRTTEASVRMTFTSRASRESRLDGTVTALDALARAVGGTVGHHSRYPGWEYAPVSPLRDAYREAYRAVCGKEMTVVAIHAGLECGYIKKQINDMDI
ncbi:MAG: beta-Ala-His dipeptidase, partial [Clostridia bacterium]|nr:beta-Ala-His dipeptidase [Clostridia bacterium]